MKILIAIISVDGKSQWSKLENGIRNTWASQKHENIDIIFYYHGNETKLIGDKLYLNTGKREDFKTIGNKTVEMFDFVLKKFDFDFIYRTNLSSYIEINNLKKFIKDKPTKKFCSAIKGISGDGISFPSGSGYFLSKDIVELIVRHKEQWNHSLIDDNALGYFLMKHNIKITPGRRVNLNDATVSDATLKKHINEYHFRVKNKNNRQNDIILMNRLYSMFNKS